LLGADLSEQFDAGGYSDCQWCEEQQDVSGRISEDGLTGVLQAGGADRAACSCKVQMPGVSAG
jgi:hypothetical protein